MSGTSIVLLALWSYTFGCSAQGDRCCWFHSSNFEIPYPGFSALDAQDRLHRIRAIYWYDTVDPNHVHPCKLINHIAWIRDWSCAEYGFRLSDYEAEMEGGESATD
jgi:hypothetical protein